MRLTDILSKPLTSKFEQVEGFLNNTKLKCGRQKKLKQEKSLYIIFVEIAILILHLYQMKSYSVLVLTNGW